MYFLRFFGGGKSWKILGNTQLLPSRPSRISHGFRVPPSSWWDQLLWMKLSARLAAGGVVGECWSTRCPSWYPVNIYIEKTATVQKSIGFSLRILRIDLHMAVLSMSILVYWSVTEMFYGCSWDDWIVAEGTNWLVGWLVGFGDQHQRVKLFVASMPKSEAPVQISKLRKMGANNLNIPWGARLFGIAGLWRIHKTCVRLLWPFI